MHRRCFITALGTSAMAWPVVLNAQQRTLPVIGFLGQSPDGYTDRLRGFRQGLKETGFVEGENVAIEYRWAENQMDRLPRLAADLVNRRVAVITAFGGPEHVQVAKAATTAIPIIFIAGEDPARLGLVASLARPGGNLTGVNLYNDELSAKRLNLMLELVPSAVRVAVLVNPANASSADTTTADLTAAARTLGLQLTRHNAGTVREIETAFATFAAERPDLLFVAGDPFFNSRRVHLVQLAAHHHIPTTYASRAYAEVGGLMAYGSDVTDAYRQAGAYTGRILKGAKPADLPVVQASKFEFVINNPTARMLGITVPTTLLTIADEVIE
jgi:ABC-type uncharacterized transport system substrate-binding protein